MRFIAVLTENKHCSAGLLQPVDNDALSFPKLRDRQPEAAGIRCAMRNDRTGTDLCQDRV